MMSDKLDTRVIQVTNIAPSVTKDQMKTLFNYLGRIDEIKLYPSERSDSQVGTRVCYVKYDDTSSVGVALHLTNTVFIDRALIIVPVMDGKIPDENTALQMAPSAVAGMIPGQPAWPSNVISQLQGTGLQQVITTNDPRLTALGLPQYPPLPGSTDPSKIEEIRRTVYVSNLEPVVTGDQILSFFSQVGEIKYVRMGGEGVGEARCAYVEFSDQRSVATALTYNGVMFQGSPIKVSHSLSSIIKPKSEMQKASEREIEEAMKKVKEAQSLITAAADSGDLNIDKAVSRLASGLGRSRSRSRSGSRYRSRSKRSRSHRRSRSRKRSRSRRRSRSRSESKKKSVSPPKRKLGPGMPPLPGSIKKRERSRSRHRRSRSRSRTRRKSRSRSRRRSRTPSSYRRRSRRSRSRSRTSRRRSRSRDRKRSRSRERRRSRSRDRKRSRSREKRKSRTRSGSPEKKKSRSRSLSIPKLRRADSEISSHGDPPPAKSSPAPDLKAKSPKKSSSGQSKSRSRSPVRKSSRRSRSRSRSKGRRNKKSTRRSKSKSPERRRRSRSRKRSRSRSGSRHRSSRKDKKKDKDRERDRDNSHDREKEKSKKKHKEKEKEREKEEKKENKVTRDYDEEEMNLYGDLDRQYKEEEKAAPIQTIITAGEKSEDSNLQQVDMDMSD